MNRIFLFLIALFLVLLTAFCSSDQKNITDDSETPEKIIGFTPGSFEGIVPDIDNKHEVRIYFKSDSNFIMEEFISGLDEPIINKGKWNYSKEEQKISLIYDNLMDRTTTFVLINPDTLHMSSDRAFSKGNPNRQCNLNLIRKK